MAPVFDHERLHVYQQALQFVTWSTELLSEVSVKAAVKDQLDHASTSVPLNIAEGNAKWTAKDRIKFLKIATGSALECAACLDVLVAKGLIEEARVTEGKELLRSTIAMLIKLSNNVDNRLREGTPEYGNEQE